jgi:hypothetical protein
MIPRRSARGPPTVSRPRRKPAKRNFDELVGDPECKDGSVSDGGGGRQPSAAEAHAVGEEHGWRLGRIADPFGHHAS